MLIDWVSKGVKKVQLVPHPHFYDRGVGHLENWLKASGSIFLPRMGRGSSRNSGLAMIIILAKQNISL